MRLKSQKGISAVEFAVILPLLLILLFGIIEFGFLLYDKAMLTNASREGARAGIVQAPARLTDAQIKTIVKNYCKNYLITFGSDKLEDSNITITPASRDGLPFGADLTVTVRYRYDFMVLPKFMTTALGPINLVAQTLMKLE